MDVYTLQQGGVCACSWLRLQTIPNWVELGIGYAQPHVACQLSKLYNVSHSTSAFSVLMRFVGMNVYE